MTASAGSAPDGRLPLDPDVDGGPRVRADLALAVVAGGCLGGLARYAAGRAWPAPADAIPWSTLAVNLAGAFVLGVVVAVALRRATTPLFRAFAGTGFCGALTTFSSLVVSSDELVAHHRPAAAAGYLALSVVGGLAAVTVGYALARRC